jgi:ElaB/YqjD/DUF883 family membrane-anchored ribosome-binding protein
MEDPTGTTAAPGAEGESGGEDSGGRFGRAKEFVNEKYSAASDAVKDKYAAASAAAKDKYSAAKEKLGEVDFNGMAEQVRSYVRSNPGKALLISVGVGFVIGLLLRRDDDES